MLFKFYISFFFGLQCFCLAFLMIKLECHSQCYTQDTKLIILCYVNNALAMFLFTLVQNTGKSFFNLIFLSADYSYEHKLTVPSICCIHFRSKPGKFKMLTKNDLSFVYIKTLTFPHL